jgi:hypothetical protein
MSLGALREVPANIWVPVLEPGCEVVEFKSRITAYIITKNLTDGRCSGFLQSSLVYQAISSLKYNLVRRSFFYCGFWFHTAMLAALYSLYHSRWVFFFKLSTAVSQNAAGLICGFERCKLSLRSKFS